MKTASTQDRPITAHDTEEAVRSLKVNGRARGFRGLAPTSAAATNGSTVPFQVCCGHAIRLAPTLPHGASKHELGQERTVEEYLDKLVGVFPGRGQRTFGTCRARS